MTYLSMRSAKLLANARKSLAGGALRRLSLAMGAGIVARLALLGLSITVARHFGADDFGAFTYATGTALVVGQLATMGWPPLQNKLIPIFREQRDWGRMVGLLRGSDRAIAVASLLAAAIVAGFSLVSEKLGPSLLLAALLIPPFAFCIQRRQQLAAFRKAYVGMLFDQGFGAACTVVLFLLLGSMTLGLTVLTYGIATALGGLVTLVMVRRLAPVETLSAEPIFETRKWLLLSLPIMLGTTSKLLLGKTDILLLGPLSTLLETGLYGAAFRITYVLSFPQVVLMTIVTPALGEAFAKSNPHRVQRVLRGSLAVTTIITLPLVLLTLFFAEQVLMWVFGAEFIDAANVLRILVAGQAASCFAMIFASMLIMGGREKAFAMWNSAMLALNVLLGIVLIPWAGATGAAIATTGVAIIAMIGQLALSRHLWAAKAVHAISQHGDN